MRNLRTGLLAVLVAVVTAGCSATATVDSGPFETYRQAFSELRTGAEEALAFEREWAYENYMNELASGDSVSPVDVILEFPAEEGNPFAWSMPGRPIFLTLEDSGKRLSRVNDLFSRYTTLLVRLAGGDSDDAGRIETLAERLNENSRSAGRALGLNTDSEGPALFATAAAAAARAYLEHRRTDDLRTVLEGNQQAVEAFADLGAELVALSARGVKTEYVKATDAWKKQVVNASPDQHAGLVAQQLELNRNTISQLEALRSLRDGYREVAETHRALARTMDEETSLKIGTLMDRAREVRDLYRRLRDTGPEDVDEEEE